MEPNPAAVFDNLLAYQRTAALRAAIEIDLFRALGESPANSALYRDRERMHVAAGFKGLAPEQIQAGAESVVVGLS